MSPTPAAQLTNATIWIPSGKRILCDASLTILPGEFWVIVGPNGAGKTTLMSLLAAERHPSSGVVEILGETLGHTDMRALRQRIGRVDPGLRLMDWMTGLEATLTGIRGTLRPTWSEIDPADADRALASLSALAAEQYADRELATISAGERQRVRIARALITKPDLLLLDEPATGLDFPAREALLHSLDALRSSRSQLPIVMVSHHLEELPTGITHVALIANGRIMDAGPARSMLTSAKVSACFGFPIDVHELDGRWAARASAGWTSRQAAATPYTADDDSAPPSREASE